jgi:YHS domain-containing protein
MKRAIWSLMVCCVLVGAIAFAVGKRSEAAPSDKVAARQPTTRPTTQPSADAKPINKFCAVDRDDEVDPKVTFLYKGKLIGFCCESCIPKFKKDPEKYMKGLK